MRDNLMHELQAEEAEVLEEPEVFQQVLTTKQRLIRLTNEHVHDLVGFKTKCIATVKEFEALTTFLNLLMGDVAIDRTAADLAEFHSPADWFDVPRHRDHLLPPAPAVSQDLRAGLISLAGQAVNGFRERILRGLTRRNPFNPLLKSASGRPQIVSPVRRMKPHGSAPVSGPRRSARPSVSSG